MESQFVSWLRSRLRPHSCLQLGVGDDAAILQLGSRQQTVVTTDLLTDHIDFELDAIDPKRAGRKALAVNLSDLAAMAASPIAGVVALALPEPGGKRLGEQLYEGLLPLAERYGVAIAGGDTNSWKGPLVICITLIGQVAVSGPLLRSGAQAGDKILVTGALGGSILGKHFDFEPRVQEAQFLHEHYELHAGIDISDGLTLDLKRLADESRLGAVVDLGVVPISDAAVALAEQRADDVTARDHALSDGEDFELLLAVPPKSADCLLAKQPLDVGLTCIGEFIEQGGLWQREPGQRRRQLDPVGFEHMLG